MHYESDVKIFTINIQMLDLSLQFNLIVSYLADLNHICIMYNKFDRKKNLLPQLYMDIDSDKTARY